VHISKLGNGKRIGKVEDVVKVGDKLRVESSTSTTGQGLADPGGRGRGASRPALPRESGSTGDAGSGGEAEKAEIS